MPRYVDVEKAISAFKEARNNITNVDELIHLSTSMVLIDTLPTEDVAPVVHGKWIVTNCIQDYVSITCSACNFKWRNRRYMQYQKYCPNCGAKMDGEIKSL